MKVEEAIEQIKLLKPFLGYEDSDLSKRIIESLDMAIFALEKEVVKKPINNLMWECPNCRNAIHHGQKVMHCRRCGQKVDWS